MSERKWTDTQLIMDACKDMTTEQVLAYIKNGAEMVELIVLLQDAFNITVDTMPGNMIMQLLTKMEARS